MFSFQASLYVVLEFSCEFVQSLTHGGLLVRTKCVHFSEPRQALVFYDSRYVELGLLVLFYFSVFFVLSVICVV
ncbi:hypothetical protein A8277_25645 [Salmonella enterica subsp. enterica serovar Typhimurium]|nr:hypothetical protein A8277_25645 [Salmonella enterica subsp. enterica serovar Typhimurium]